MAKRGPKLKCDKKKCERAYQLISEGMKMREVAEALNIAWSTFALWRHTHKEFAEAVQAGLDCFDDNTFEELRLAYHKKITGFTYTEKKTIYTLDKNKKPVIKKVEATEKYVPPDTTILIFEKKHRDPRYKTENNKSENKDELLFLPDEEQAELIEKLWEKLGDKKHE